RRTAHLRGRLFSDLADEFLKWLDATKRGELSDGHIRYYKQKWSLLRDHPNQFFDGKKNADVDHHVGVERLGSRSSRLTMFTNGSTCRRRSCLTRFGCRDEGFTIAVHEQATEDCEISVGELVLNC